MIITPQDTPRLTIGAAVFAAIKNIPLGGEMTVTSVQTIEGTEITIESVRAHVSNQTPTGWLFKVRKATDNTIRIYRVR